MTREESFPAVETVSFSRHCSRQVGFSTVEFQCCIRNRCGHDNDFLISGSKLRDVFLKSTSPAKAFWFLPFWLHQMWELPWEASSVVFFWVHSWWVRIKPDFSGLLISLWAHNSVKFLSVWKRMVSVPATEFQVFVVGYHHRSCLKE